MAYQRTTERRSVSREEPVVDPQHDVTAETTRSVSTDPYDDRRDAAWRASQLVWLVFGVAIALIAIRFVLLLLGANPDAGFTDFIYTVTNPLVRPFEGIFAIPPDAPFDLAALMAIVFLFLVAALIVALVKAIAGRTA